MVDNLVSSDIFGPMRFSVKRRWQASPQVVAGLAAVLLATSCGRVPTATGPGDQTASAPRTQTPTTVSSPSASSCASTPSPRGDSAFAYVPGLQEGVLYGGQDSQNRYLSDTWIWKAGCFTEVLPAHNPPSLTDRSAAYDAARGVVVVVGGYYAAAGGWVTSTWTWNGQDWAPTPATTPQLPARSIAYDPKEQKVLMFGETVQGGDPQTWAWDGAQWSQLSPSTEPPPRQQASMVFDSRTGTVVLFGGIAGANNQELADMWSWNGSTWSELHPHTNPEARADATLVPASAQGRLLLVGGEHAPAVLSDAWAWDGSNWTSIASFGARAGASAIDTGSQVVLFGGWSDKLVTNQTWVWSGAGWAAR